MKPINRLIIVVLLPLLVLMLPAFATAESNITVCVSGPPTCDYASIQAAIDAAKIDDTIVISAGMYTEQLTLKSNLTLTTTDGPTSAIVTALASPIISGSQVKSIALYGLSIRGNSTLTQPIGIDLFSSTLTLSNVIIADLHGMSGTTVYTNGADAIGLRLTGLSNLTITQSIIQNITGGDGLPGAGATGGDAFGLWAEGSGTVSMTATMVRHIVGGNAGTLTYGPFMCKGAGGSSFGSRASGDIDLSVADSTVTDLVGGRPCRPSMYTCAENAGQVRGIETNGGTLNLSHNTITNLHVWTSYENAASVAVSTSHASKVRIADTEIADLTAFENSSPGHQPTSPYCAPPPGSAIGIASNGDNRIQITRNNLHDIIGLNFSSYGKGISTYASQVITIAGNRISQLRSGPRRDWGQVLAYQALGIEVSTAEAVSIKDNRIEQLQGNEGESVYLWSSTGGGSTAGIQIESAAHSQIVNNIITTLIGGRGADIVENWSPASAGGDAIGIHLNGGLSQVWNNTVYDVRGGAGGQPDQPAGASAGLKASAMGNVLVFNNAFISSTVGVTLTSSAYLWDYNALWDTALNYSGIVTGTHDLHIDPRFIDATHGDFHLAFSSPLIDRGFTPIFPSDDLAGNPRPIDGNGDGVPVTDIGAYEFQPVPLYRQYLPVILH